MLQKLFPAVVLILPTHRNSHLARLFAAMQPVKIAQHLLLSPRALQMLGAVGATVKQSNQAARTGSTQVIYHRLFFNVLGRIKLSYLRSSPSQRLVGQLHRLAFWYPAEGERDTLSHHFKA